MARRPSAKPTPEGEGRPSSTRAKRKLEPESRGRRFFLEFLSVTLGVLLALILEQAATSWRERQRVADIRAAMDKEVSDYAEIFAFRLRYDECIGTKLDALEAHLRGGPAPVYNVGRPKYYFSGRSAFSSDATEHLSRHLGAEKVQKYGELYQGMADFAEFSGDEQKLWVVLQTLEGDRDPIGIDRRAHLREAIAGARNDDLLLHAIAEQMIRGAGNLGIAPNRSLEGIKRDEITVCVPLAAKPAPAPAP